MSRMCIYPKDVQIITGRSESYGRKLLCKIKIAFDKQPYQLVSVGEFCAFMGLDTNEVLRQLC